MPWSQTPEYSFEVICHPLLNKVLSPARILGCLLAAWMSTFLGVSENQAEDPQVYNPYRVNSPTVALVPPGGWGTFVWV